MATRSVIARSYPLLAGLLRERLSVHAPGVVRCKVLYPVRAHRPVLGARFLSDTASGSGGDNRKEGDPAAEAAPVADDGGAPPGTATDSASDDAAGAKPEASREAELEAQVKDLKDQLLRSLAEQDNTRRIAARDVESARQFAIKNFAKSLLEVSDNLTRALESVPEEVLADRTANPVLGSLYEGIQLTEAGLSKAFELNGLVKYGEVGDKFDPNQHEALMQYPDPNREDGVIGQVMKKGFFLNKRVLRPAEVGIVKNS